jgi:hypothetical protein
MAPKKPVPKEVDKVRKALVPIMKYLGIEELSWHTHSDMVAAICCEIKRVTDEANKKAHEQACKALENLGQANRAENELRIVTMERDKYFSIFVEILCPKLNRETDTSREDLKGCDPNLIQHFNQNRRHG